MGPKAGSEGGQIVYEGDFAGLLKLIPSLAPICQYKRPLKTEFRQARGKLSGNSCYRQQSERCQRRYSHKHLTVALA